MSKITNREKCEICKTTIEYLYSKEGRTKSYISRLLDIDRSFLTKAINNWGIPQAKPKRRLKPSNQKFLNKHRGKILSLINNDVPVTLIAKELGVSYGFLQRTIIECDEQLAEAKKRATERKHERRSQYIECMKEKSCYVYDYEEIPGEEWKPILGHERHEVSNMGRVRSYVKSYDSYHLLTPNKNSFTGRMYIHIDGKGLMLARVVAHAFCEGWCQERNTVNHVDGDIENNKASNLEWASQSENNKHAYEKLNRTKVNFRRYVFDEIEYDNRRFLTVSALAKYIGKSETQTRRYLDYPEKHGIKLIRHCND